MNNKQQSLAGVKAGDQIFAKSDYRSWGGERQIPFDIFTVERMTAKQIIAKTNRGHEYRFRIEDGRKLGSNSYGDFAFVPTDEQIKEQTLAVKVRLAQDAVKRRMDAVARGKSASNANDDFWLAVQAAIETFDDAKGGKGVLISNARS